MYASVEMKTASRTAAKHMAQPTAVGTVITWAGMTRIAATLAGVREVWLPSWTPTTTPLSVDTPEIVIEQSYGGAAERHLRQGLRELAEYIAGERHTFTVVLDLPGPVFFRRVWDEVARAPHRRGNTVCVDFEHSEDACRRLIERGFVVDWRPQGGIRISPHFYNSDDECRAIMAEIKELRGSGTLCPVTGPRTH